MIVILTGIMHLGIVVASNNSVVIEPAMSVPFDSEIIGFSNEKVILSEVSRNNSYSRYSKTYVYDLESGLLLSTISSKGEIKPIIATISDNKSKDYLIVTDIKNNGLYSISCYNLHTIEKKWETSETQNIMCWDEDQITKVSDRIVFCTGLEIDTSIFRTYVDTIDIETGTLLSTIPIYEDKIINGFVINTLSMSLVDYNDDYYIFKQWKDIEKDTHGYTAPHLVVYNSEFECITSLPDINFSEINKLDDRYIPIENEHNYYLWGDSVLYPVAYYNNLTEEFNIDIKIYNISNSSTEIIRTITESEGLLLNYFYIYDDLLIYGLSSRGHYQELHCVDLATLKEIRSNTFDLSIIGSTTHSTGTYCYCITEDINNKYELSSICLESLNMDCLIEVNSQIHYVYYGNGYIIHSSRDETLFNYLEKTSDTIIRYILGSKYYFIGNEKNTMDVTPTIINQRTLLPARYVVEPLGGQVFWDGDERKVTCKLLAPDNPDTDEYKENTVELWIDNPIAKVNGEEVQIDPDNPDVVPTIINDRTMVPMRFLAESLGCEVKWVADTKEIILTYSP